MGQTPPLLFCILQANKGRPENEVRIQQGSSEKQVFSVTGMYFSELKLKADNCTEIVPSLSCEQSEHLLGALWYCRKHGKVSFLHFEVLHCVSECVTRSFCYPRHSSYHHHRGRHRKGDFFYQNQPLLLFFLSLNL